MVQKRKRVVKRRRGMIKRRGMAERRREIIERSISEEGKGEVRSGGGGVEGITKGKEDGWLW